MIIIRYIYCIQLCITSRTAKVQKQTFRDGNLQILMCTYCVLFFRQPEEDRADALEDGGLDPILGSEEGGGEKKLGCAFRYI